MIDLITTRQSYNIISTVPIKTAGPVSHTSLAENGSVSGAALNPTESSAIAVLTLQETSPSLPPRPKRPNEYAAMAEATIPVPHANVSSSTPFSNVRTARRFPPSSFNSSTKSTLVPSGAKRGS